MRRPFFRVSELALFAMRQRKRKGDADLPARKRSAGIQGLRLDVVKTADSDALREHAWNLS
jgi:hypothetical protein